MPAPATQANGLYAKQSHAVMCAAVAGVLGLLTLGTLAQGLRTGMNIFPIVAFALSAVWFSTRPIVQAYGTHLVIKKAPLAGRKLIAFDDVVGVHQPSPRKARLMVRQGDRTVAVALPMNLLSPADGAKLLGLVRRQIAAHAA